jgi:hypothetical protein
VDKENYPYENLKINLISVAFRFIQIILILANAPNDDKHNPGIILQFYSVPPRK